MRPRKEHFPLGELKEKYMRFALWYSLLLKLISRIDLILYRKQISY